MLSTILDNSAIAAATAEVVRRATRRGVNYRHGNGPITGRLPTSKLGAWKVIVIALVLCYLVPLGSADTGNKDEAEAEAEEMIAGGIGHGVYLTSDVPGEVHDDKDKNSGTLKLRVGELDFPKTESADLFTSDNIKLGETDELLGEVGGIGELDFLVTESADLLTSDDIKLGEADMPGFKMHKELADFFDMIEDDEKYAIWEKEEMPKTLALIETDTERRRARSRKQKSWARKAIAKAEIDTCWRQKSWKNACYPMICKRWDREWWMPFSVCGGGYRCNGRDRNILGCCHQDCGGWSDDGSSCTKHCSSQSMTPYSCSHLQCATDWQSCAVSALQMAFSIVDMLSSICPASKLKTLATKVAKAASTAARKAVIKQFARAIAVRLMRKAKRKAKKFMKSHVKNGVRYLRESVVDAILQEAAEAFAIERARKERELQIPSFEDVARALDPIGVAGVVDAFSLDSCNSAEIETFPGCYEGWAYENSFYSVYLWTEDNCCGEVYDSGWHSTYKVHFMHCYAAASEEYDLSDVSEFNTNTTDIDEFDDDDFYSNPNITFVDAIDADNLNVTKEVLFLCNTCARHTACLDNEIETANLTFYNACEAAGCCGDEPPDEVPDVDLHIETILKIIRSGNETSDEPDVCNGCDMFCGDTTLQGQHPMFYDHCMSKNCCPQM